MKIFIILLAIVAAGSFFTYKYLFTGNPQDLNQKYSEAAYASAHQKISTSVESLPADTPLAQSLRYSGQKDINVSLTSEEITSYLQSEKWVYSPISQVQVRINPDGSAEASGVLNLNNVLPYISLTTPIEQVQKAIEKFHISGNPTFYVKGSVEVINNRASFDIQSLQIARIPVPSNYISENLNAVDDFVSDRLNSVPNLNVRSLTLDNGQANLDATVPESVKKAQ